MAGDENFSSEFIKKANAVRLNTSSCQVYMGIKSGETIPFVGDLVFTSDDSNFSTDLILSPKVGSQTFSVYYPNARPHLPPKYAVVSSSNARFEDWINLSSDDYEARRNSSLSVLFQVLKKLFQAFGKKLIM